MPIQIIGRHLSPYVRKVLVTLHIKSIPFEMDPLVPFFGNDKFAKLSPLRVVPVLIDDGFHITDSSVICQYLEDKYPTPSIYPENIQERAKARWIEEFADTKLSDVIVWKLYFEGLVKGSVWQIPKNNEMIEKVKNNEIPRLLDIIEKNIIKNPEEFLFHKNQLSIADISLASVFRNAEFVKYSIDAEKWPKSAKFIRKVLDHPGFLATRECEEICLKTKGEEQREGLKRKGVKIVNLGVTGEKPINGMFEKTHV